MEALNLDTNRLIARTLKLIIDEWRAFCIVGFDTRLFTDKNVEPVYLRIFIKPYDGTLDKEIKSHTISLTKNLEYGESLESLTDDLTKESIVSAVLHHVKNNLSDIKENNQPEKSVKLTTEPYKKIK
tara:strand:+ start:959 stop:1339 length:381 start_codon:yes stop_codon:yes gene_type:complete